MKALVIVISFFLVSTFSQAGEMVTGQIQFVECVHVESLGDRCIVYMSSKTSDMALVYGFDDYLYTNLGLKKSLGMELQTNKCEPSSEKNKKALESYNQGFLYFNCRS